MRTYPKGCKIYPMRGGALLTDTPYRTTDPRRLGDGLWSGATSAYARAGDVMVIQPRGKMKWWVFAKPPNHWGWEFRGNYRDKDVALMAAALL